MIHVGVDLHQRFCYMTALDSRGKLLNAQAVANETAALQAYFRQFKKPVRAVVEACSFWPAFRAAVGQQVELRLAHSQQVKAIAAAKLKNDRIDSATLAHLLRCDLLPEGFTIGAQNHWAAADLQVFDHCSVAKSVLLAAIGIDKHQQGAHIAGEMWGGGDHGRSSLHSVAFVLAGRNRGNLLFRRGEMP